MSTSPDTTTSSHRIAIIGGGITGLSAAWHLATSTHHEITLFESDSHLGGHAKTVTVNSTPLDIGFMVFNDQNYPNLTHFFHHLNVKSEPSDMSLAISLDNGSIEWNSNGYGLFHIASILPSLLHFHNHAKTILSYAKDDPRRNVTVGEWLRREGYGDDFGRYYLLPMMAALWSSSLGDVLEFPMEQLVGFLGNHSMLQVFDRPKWKTVQNRSKSYTQTLQTILSSNIQLSTPIHSMKQKSPPNQNNENLYELFTTGDKSVGTFHQIVFACHTDTAHSILQHCLTSVKEQALLELLSKIEYAENDMYVHSDPKLMPRKKELWCSWNCIGRKQDLKWKESKSGKMMEGSESGFGATKPTSSKDEPRMKECFVTYYLNKLQNLKSETDYFVSLNPHTKPKEELIHGRYRMAHPQFTPQSLRARDALSKDYQGKNGLWFCGAWAGNGFHEDGCRSGFEVATALSGKSLPWAKKKGVPVLPPPDFTRTLASPSMLRRMYKFISYTVPVAVCKRLMYRFLKKAIGKGVLEIKGNDGKVVRFGKGVGGEEVVTMRVFDDWFFVKVCLEYDLGLARSYMSGLFNILPLSTPSTYNSTLYKPTTPNETNLILGDPIGLTRLFLLLIQNRDTTTTHQTSSARIRSGPLSTASGLFLSKLGSFYNFCNYKLWMQNTEYGGSMENIHAHYNLSNALFECLLDKETMTYSSAIYDVVVSSNSAEGMMVAGTLEEAQLRKLDTLLSRAGISDYEGKKRLKVLDIGFGWGGLSIRAAQKYNCEVVGITLSKEQMAYAQDKVERLGLDDRIRYEIVDYRTFAKMKENYKKFDVVLSCEMIEAVGHDHLGPYFAAVEKVLKTDGVFVMEAITTPEIRYEAYKRSTDFINTIIFPGSCCPSLHSLVDASYQSSTLTLQHITNINLHYAETLREWRRRFNAHSDWVKKQLGFDDVFLRAWNYYLTYCEAGFYSRTENCLILKFSRVDGTLVV